MDMYQKREMRKNKKMNDGAKSLPSTGINWYPGHMAKTKRLISENLNLIDIVYEVLDARIPLSSKIIDIDNILKNKPKILIMTKYDLCDKNETNKFINMYELKGYHVLKYDLNKTNNLNDLYDLSRKILKDKLEKNKEKGLKNKPIRALVIGIPNVGKSTLINKMAKKNKALVGNKPGVTKNIGWIKVSPDIEIMDSPGILWPKLDQNKIAYNLALTSSIKEEILPLDDVVVYIIKYLYKYYPSILKEQYQIENIDDFSLVFEQIGQNKHLLAKGGIVDSDKVVRLVFNDIKSGKLKDVTFDRYED